MFARQLARATVAAVALALALAGIAAADTAPGDADLVTPGPQMARDLGTVAPGATVVADVGFTLTCKGLSHVDRGQVVTFSVASMTVPVDGALVATGGAVGPVPETWPIDGEGCPDPAPTLGLAAPIQVTLTAPTVPGMHIFTVIYQRSVAPAGSNDAAALTGMTAVDLVVTVAVTPPPPPAPPPPPPPPTGTGPSVAFLEPLAGGDAHGPALGPLGPREIPGRADPGVAPDPRRRAARRLRRDGGGRPRARDRGPARREERLLGRAGQSRRPDRSLRAPGGSGRWRRGGVRAGDGPPVTVRR